MIFLTCFRVYCLFVRRRAWCQQAITIAGNGVFPGREKDTNKNMTSFAGWIIFSETASMIHFGTYNSHLMDVKKITVKV